MKKMKWAASISKTLERTNHTNFTTTHHVFLPPSLTSLHSQFLPRFFTTPSSPFPALSSFDHPLQNPSSQSQGKNERGIWSKMLLFVPGAISFGLGTWQIFRRQEKIKMLEYRKERLEMDPVQFKAASAEENPKTMEFRKVLCRGAFDEKKSVFVGPRSRSISGVTENGYYLITPLLPISGDPESVQNPVLVNRGWVPRSWRDKTLESPGEVEKVSSVPTPSSSHGEKSSFWKFWSKKPERTEEQTHTITSVEVVGVVRGCEKPSIFVPANDPASGQWFYVDVPAIADFAGLPQNTIYIEDVDENVNPANPYPIQKDANTLIRSSVMPQDHLNYMLTWYSLSAAVTFMAYKRLKPRKIRR